MIFLSQEILCLRNIFSAAGKDGESFFGGPGGLGVGVVPLDDMSIGLPFGLSGLVRKLLVFLGVLLQEFLTLLLYFLFCGPAPEREKEEQGKN